MPDSALLWAPMAWTPTGWRERVLLRIGGDGRWAEVTPDVAVPPADALVLQGPLLPGLVDAHSHAFQRAFAGRAERRDALTDDFWSWRDRMYRVALRISPAQLRAIAAQLYVELLKGGYTQVCEFHYLQHDVDGKPYSDPLEMSWALADAAAEVGIGLTLLPVLYERAGFVSVLHEDQRRFKASAEGVWRAATDIAATRRPLVNAGLAIHSLRAALAASIGELRRHAEGFAGPIHIHVAEQTAEVDECLQVTGSRPIEWLAKEGLLDARWQLVHATHTAPGEIDVVASSGAGVVLCPSTEANLGDGLADVRGWLAAGVPMTIGSDSQVTRDWREELRWLECGQRLALRQRNVSAAPQAGVPSTAERLFGRVVEGGAAAAGESAWGLVVGARADGLVVDAREDALLGLPPGSTLDALIFSSPSQPWRDVMVAGRWALRAHRHEHAESIAHRFAAAMHELA
jgi:formimidoylglutamate deiminase